MRPPGHHALADSGMGFCIFNNVVVAALHARAANGVGRIAIVDWDVHHGNGAQSAFYDHGSGADDLDPSGRGLPAGIGAPEEIGVDDGEGRNVNVALPPGSGAGACREAVARVVAPALRAFSPELILMASGFDANGMDPLGRQLLLSEDFRQLMRSVAEIAHVACDGRIVLAHEGGYAPAVVPFCGLAVLEELSGHRTEVVDPYAPLIAAFQGETLLPDQSAAIERTPIAHASVA